MKQMKRIIGILLSIVLIFGAIPMSAEAALGGRDWRWPVPATSTISSCYGEKRTSGTHYALDISAGGGAAIYASYPGEVIYAFTGCPYDSAKPNGTCSCGKCGDLGNSVYIRHSYNGASYVSRYGHMRSVNVSIGQNVTKDTVIGTVGSTGGSTGNHLDFMIYKGTSTSVVKGRDCVDPFKDEFLELPAGFKANAGTSCCYTYVDEVKALYSGNIQRSPVGAFDIATGGENSVYVRGWAYDPDDISRSVSIHVYIDGKHVGTLAADGYRSDVNNIYGCGEYHGFVGDVSYNVTSSGEHTVEVYALDLTYGSGGVYLGSKTITITPDATPPVISNVVIEPDSEGYTITCDVEDKSEIDRAMFPSWTSYNGQDDLEGADGSWPNLQCHRGTVSNGKATFRVNRSDHNNEYGEYRTHIYIYDVYGNGSMEAVTYTLEKHEHSYTGKITKQPTCTEEGVKNYSCDCGDSYTESIIALGHKYGSWTTVKSATCEGAGSEKRVCERCNNAETRTVAAKGHTYETVVTAQSCTRKGYSTHTCKTCGDSYTDSEKAALGHKYGSWTIVKSATCEEGGIEKRGCERCDYEEIQKTSASGHTYKTVVMLPTCEESGYTTYTCKVCGHSYEGDEKAALGHSFTNYISDNNATEDFPGTKTAKCDRCNATDTIPETSEEVPENPVNKEVIRLAGNTRYDTGYAVANVLKETLGVDKFEAVVVATGKNFADALAGSYLAVQKNAPIILTNGNADNVARLHEYIKANVRENGTVYILGGEAAVPESVEDISGYTVKRLAGSSRYDTNLEILLEAGIPGDEIIVATGKSFADSLSASAAKLPILLVKPKATLDIAQKALLKDMNKIYIVGGEGAVSSAYETELAAYGMVERVFGSSRYDTSVEIAKAFSGSVDKIVVASGKNFPDGLCGGPLAAALNVPLILTRDNGADAAMEYAEENAVVGGYVLGGTGALTDDTVVDVFKLESAQEIK